MGLLDKVKDVAGKAAEQAKHATEVGKEKLEDRKLAKQVETLLQEIGEIVVRAAPRHRGRRRRRADHRQDRRDHRARGADRRQQRRRRRTAPPAS